MREIRFEGLSTDTKILSIGSLFRKSDGSQWGVNLGFLPAQNKKSLTLSHATVLVRKRVLNPSVEPKPAGYSLSFTIASIDSWQQKTLADYPNQAVIGVAERNQRCFYFMSDKRVQIFLSQFELARALFFHNGYLSRTSLEPDCLKAEFDVQLISPEEARINILPSCSYPLKLLDDHGARRLLSWLLIDREARASFESIGRYQKLHGHEKNGYRFWDFQFDPPDLQGVSLDVRGHFDKAANSMFVYEIAGVRHVKVDVPELVEFHHPEFKEYVRGQGSGVAGAIAGSPDEHAVNDEAEASADKQQVLLYAPPVTFEFSKPFETRKVASKKHLLIDGNQRRIAVVEVVCGGTAFHILEVDTSDAVNSLSTLLLRFKSKDNWDDQIVKLEKALMKNSLHWPNSVLEELCEKNEFTGIPHPKTKSTDKGLLESASVARWAARFRSRMVEM